jgi:hypothetical protein
MLFCLSQRTWKMVPRNSLTHFRNPLVRSLATQNQEINYLFLSPLPENIYPSAGTTLGPWAIQDQCCIYFPRHALALLPHLHTTAWIWKLGQLMRMFLLCSSKIAMMFKICFLVVSKTLKLGIDTFSLELKTSTITPFSVACSPKHSGSRLVPGRSSENLTPEYVCPFLVSKAWRLHECSGILCTRL